MIIENHKNSTEVIEQDNDFIPVLPLTDAHTPKKLRRRIFLDKLNKMYDFLIFFIYRCININIYFIYFFLLLIDYLIYLML